MVWGSGCARFNCGLRPESVHAAGIRNSIRSQGTAGGNRLKKVRVQDGQLFVCYGCCCGRVEKGFPPLALEELKKQWKDRGIRKRFHLTVSGCLGPCTVANVVLLQFQGKSVWLHSINSEEDVRLIYDYVEQMLQADCYLPGGPRGPALPGIRGGYRGPRLLCHLARFSYKAKQEDDSRRHHDERAARTVQPRGGPGAC